MSQTTDTAPLALNLDGDPLLDVLRTVDACAVGIDPSRGLLECLGYTFTCGTPDLGPLEGKWWWVLGRPGWGGYESAVGDFQTREQARADALCNAAAEHDIDWLAGTVNFEADAALRGQLREVSEALRAKLAQPGAAEALVSVRRRVVEQLLPHLSSTQPLDLAPGLHWQGSAERSLDARLALGPGGGDRSVKLTVEFGHAASALPKWCTVDDGGEVIAGVLSDVLPGRGMG